MNNKENTARFDEIKDELRTSLVPIAGNEGWLKHVPHKEIEDLALTYKVSLGENSEPERMTVTNEMVEMLGMNSEQFMEAADLAVLENEPPVIRDLMEVLGIQDGAGEYSQLFVASNARYHEGAGVIGYPGFLEKAADFMQGDFIVLPSSIHEVLLLKDNGALSIDELKDIVQSVNQSVVDPKDQLSDQVYHFDSQDKVFELAEKFGERKNHEREAARHSVLTELKNSRDRKEPAKSEKTKKLSQEAR